MTVADDLVARVSKIIQDSSFSDEDILVEVNDCVKTVAAGPVLITGARLAPLPRLFTSDTVDTVTDEASVDLPADYLRQVRSVVSNTSKSRIPVEASFEKFIGHNPALDDTGSDVIEVSIMGNSLYYRPIPTDAITLTLHYYRAPVDMGLGDAASQQAPDGLPKHLWYPLITNYAARNLFGVIDGDDGALSGTIDKHDAAFQKALYDLHRFIGPARVDPWNVGDNGNDPSWFEVQ